MRQINKNKCILILRNEECKQQFLFWRKNEEFNNNFSYQETKDLRQFPFQKQMDLMQQWKYFEINSSMIKKNALNKHWTNFLSKEEEVGKVTGQSEVLGSLKHIKQQTENKLQWQIQWNLDGFWRQCNL